MRCAETEPEQALPDPPAIDAAVALFSALAHPSRLTVLVALNRFGALSVGELMELQGVEQSAMSHQLRALRDAHLVVTQRDGRRIRYRLADDHVVHIVQAGLTHAVDEACAPQGALAPLR